MGRLFLNIALGLAALAAGAIVGGYLWLRGSLPQTEGNRMVAGLAAPVDLVRDEHGVPHIFATSDADGYFALGFVHAQDRLWQMELMRRAGAGRLSELVGAQALPHDRLVRTLGLYRLAEAQAQSLPEEVSTALDAYVAGVNAYIDSHGPAWPLEYILLRTAPEPWRPADSLVWVKLMALQLSTGWRGDLLRGRLLPVLGAQRLRDLFPVDPEGAPTTIAAGTKRLLDSIGELPDMLASDSASNAWVLSGDRTATGKPILANDPHLGFDAPGLWYLARVVTPEGQVAGATVPGVPLVILGHNGHVAWGITSPGADTSDLFVETPLAGDPARYVAPAGPAPFQVHREIIAVRDSKPVEHVVRSTRHGPVISDVVPAAGAIADASQVVALAETSLLAGDRTLEGLYRMNRATNIDQFRAAATLADAPLQNLFVADTAGGIGFVAAGLMPIRAAGGGHLPVPGAEGRFDWAGFVPPDQWPQNWNPASGLITNANNRLSASALPYPYAWYWPASFRAERLVEVLRDAKRHHVDDSAALQMDTLSPAARKLAPLLTGIAVEPGPARAARDLVARWDYRMDRERPEPLIHAAWTRHLMATLAEDELGALFGSFRQPRPRFLIEALTTRRVWCDDVGTPAAETCESRVALALERAVAELGDRFGPDPAAWRWGDAHRAVFEHRILTTIPALGHFANGEIETAGGDHTLNRGQTGGGPGDPYRHTHGAGYRAVYDLADLSNSRYLIATGQSGNLLSSRYMEFLPRWRDGRYIRIEGTREALRGRGAETLTLQPLPR